MYLHLTGKVFQANYCKRGIVKNDELLLFYFIIFYTMDKEQESDLHFLDKYPIYLKGDAL